MVKYKNYVKGIIDQDYSMICVRMCISNYEVPL